MSQIDQHVGQNIRILAQVVQEVCQHHTLEEASGGALTVNQLKILKIVDHGGAVAVADIARLLEERPEVKGLSVPGMPRGSPGMEGPVSDSYDVLTFDESGGETVFASY